MIFQLGLVTLLLNVVSSFTLNSPEQDYQQHDYDLLILSVNWSPAVACDRILKKGSNSTCSPCKLAKAVHKWTIHGLWPSRSDGLSPFQCRNIPFDPELIEDSKLKPRLSSNWLSVKGPDDQFWAYEWKKHGTCAWDHEDMNSLTKYFGKTLELHNRFNIGQILDDAGIHPNNTYQSEKIHRALRDSLGAKVFVACIRSEQTRQQFLNEIHICMDKSFTLVDCKEKSIYLDNCTDEYEVTYVAKC